MPITVQDNTGSIIGANAYISVAEFKAYHDVRGGDYSAAADDTVIAAAIIRATDYVDTRFWYVGRKKMGRTQSTEWPRIAAYDRDRYAVTDVPMEVKDACAEYALRSLSDDLMPDPTRDDTGQVIQSKTETVGPITESVTYAAGAAQTVLPKYPTADQILIKSGLTRSGGTVSRG